MSGRGQWVFGRRILLLFVALWAVLTEGDFKQVWLGFFFVGAAAWSAVRLRGRKTVPPPLRVRAVIAYLGYFLYSSVTGGISAALRALRFRKVRPLYLDYRLRIPADQKLARLLFAVSICLFPGSLSCLFRGDVLVVQFLDEELFDPASLRDLETRVAGLFSLTLAEPG